MSRKLRREGEDRLWARRVWAERSSRGTRNRLPRFRLPAGLVDNPSTRRRALRLPIDRNTTPYGYSFASDGWRPHVTTLRPVAQSGSSDYGDSILGRMHARFRPPDLGRTLGSGPRRFRPALVAIPHSGPLTRDLWMLDGARLEELKTAARRAAPTARSAHVGTATINDGTDTGFGGYQLDGYVLEHGGDFRFVVLHGHHRVGAAACLGIAHLDVVIRRRCIPAARPDDLPRIAIGSGIPVQRPPRRVHAAVRGERYGQARCWGPG
jgi:hypothetical protein